MSTQDYQFETLTIAKFHGIPAVSTKPFVPVDTCSGP